MATVEPRRKLRRQAFRRFHSRTLCIHAEAAHRCRRKNPSGRRQCNPSGRLEAITFDRRTVGQVVDQFVAEGILSRGELERYLERQARWRKVKNVAALGGAIIGFTLLVFGRKLFLRLRTGKPPQC